MAAEEPTNFTCVLFFCTGHRKENDHWCRLVILMIDVYFTYLFLTGVECFHTVLAEYYVGLGMTGVDLRSRTVCQGAIFIIMLMGLEEPVFQSDPPGLTSIHTLGGKCLHSFLTDSFMTCESTFQF